MLAKPGPIPRRDGWAFEVKWDGFRAIVVKREGPLKLKRARQFV